MTAVLKGKINERHEDDISKKMTPQKKDTSTVGNGNRRVPFYVTGSFAPNLNMVFHSVFLQGFPLGRLLMINIYAIKL